MDGARAALAVIVALAVATAVLSGGSAVDPRTPPALPGLPPPLLGVAVVGDGGRTAAIDAYGNVVEVRAPGPAGEGLTHDPAKRRATRSVPAGAGLVARMSVGGRSIPLWRADSVVQRYVPGTNVLRAVARIGGTTAVVVRSIGGPESARVDRRWIRKARSLDDTAPKWADRLYTRSLLVLRALTDRRTGAVAAGISEGWAYVWPRDAAAVAIALASVGYRSQARQVVRFLLRLDLTAAARFDGDGTPVEGREAQGDAAGWVAAAARAAGLPTPHLPHVWRERADYQEKEASDFLANAIAATGASLTADGPKSQEIVDFSAHRHQATRVLSMFATSRSLFRAAGDPASGVDSAAAWAVRPFPLPALFPAARRSLHRLIEERGGRFGIAPSEDWPDDDPWTAPTAWSAWAFAALANRERTAGRIALSRADRRTALHLVGDLRRAATPLGLLPERVDAQTGLPASTTPLSWSHAFAILAIRELWPRTATR